MNIRRIKYYLKIGVKLYWIRFLVITGLLTLAISLIFLIVSGLKAWNESESYLRQSQMAVFPLQIYMQIVMGFIFALIYTTLWYWMLFKKGGGFTQVVKKAVGGKDLGITWSDVIGMDEAKQEALEIVKLIKDRAELQRIGGKILRGLLMLGPPGCGKTYLAKAIATEAGLPFISMSGSEFVEMFVGVGAGRVRSLFTKARMLAELEGGCIIFIDEIDAVGASRSVDTGFGGQTEHNTSVNQLLVEMDGWKEKDLNIVIIGATNAPMSFLDRALLRPGRFDRKIYVDKPNLEDRQKLLAYYLKKIKYDEQDVKIDRLARITVGSSPADVANLVREAALIAVRNKSVLVTMKDIDEARERITLGIKRRIKLRKEERLQTAYHEAGHAIVTYLLIPTQDVFKITITPRGHTGGVTWTPETEEIFIRDQKQLLGKIKTYLGSYVAEKIQFGITTVGVDTDFAESLYIAHSMAWRWGMGKSGIIGNYEQLDSYLWSSRGMLISEEVKRRLDEDVQDIMQTCLKEVTLLLESEKILLDRLATELVVKEELNFDEIEAIFKECGKLRPVQS
ncbi:MAG: AAA family ATPase [Candidatus Omnitrophica bacterium]|nr:AAA family ATPase [Candidatus Omnitrophota bacterium]